MEVLNAQLERVACPAFLRPTSAAQLAALDFRRPLLIWLHAVFSEPRVRLVEDESWARADPSDEQLQRWLHSLGIDNGAGLLLDNPTPDELSKHVGHVVECVEGRVLVEERGEAACLAESLEMMNDLATNQASVFDSECQIFPMSIQMQCAGDFDIAQRSTQLADDITSLERQAEALRNRIVSAKLMLENIETGTETRDSKELSHDLAGCLDETLELMKRVSDMLNEDSASWKAQTQPYLVGLGQTSQDSLARLGKLLIVIRNAESSATLARGRASRRPSLNVLAHCQQIVDAVAPELRQQRSALEQSLELAAHHSR